MNRYKKTVRLTESDLHKIIKESVKSVLNEIGDTPKGQYALGAVKGRALGRTIYQSKYQKPSERNKQGEKVEDASEKAWRHRNDVQEPKQLEKMVDKYRKGFDYGVKKGMKE